MNHFEIKKLETSKTMLNEETFNTYLNLSIDLKINFDAIPDSRSASPMNDMADEFAVFMKDIFLKFVK